MRKVAVRLKNDYSYSKDLVYNTFPIPELTVEHKKNISETAKSILDARAFYPFTARRLRPLRWEMNCVCYLLDSAS